MAELADALASGASECKFMQVQVLLSAPRRRKRFVACGDFFSKVIDVHFAVPSYREK